MPSSIRDVANLAGVSIATVSHVLNGTRNVNPETRKRVEKSIETLNYSVNAAARTLRSGSSKTIGFVVSNLSSTFYMNIARSINNALVKEGYSLIYVDSEEDPEIEKRNVRHMINQNVDGLIIVSVNPDGRYLNEIIKDHCPCVFLGRKPKGYERDAVLTTNYEAVYESIELLINKGHRNIGILGSMFNSTQQERLDGYKGALKKYDIPILDNRIIFGNGKIEGYLDQKNGESYKLARKMMQDDEITALFIADGLATIGVINYLQVHHYHIPGDIAVITFDDSFWLSMSHPTFTAMDQDTEKLGLKAAEVLLSRIHEIDSPFQSYRIPTTLIVRESC